MVPLPTPSSLVRNDFDRLRSNPYLVTEKNDGVRAVLLVGIENRTDRIILASVSRSGFVTDMRSKIYFNNGDTVEQGSILDGEWVDDTFIVFDCIAALGFSVRETNLSQRLLYAKSVVNHLQFDGVNIVVKTFYDPTSEEGQKFLRAPLKSETDGIIVAPDYEGLIELGRQFHYYKFKPLEMITVDLYWDSERQVLLCDDRELVESALPGVQWDVADFKQFGSCLLECYVRLGGKDQDDRVIFVLKPKCPRVDKNKANSAFVVQQTCRNVEENITQDELADVFA